MLKTSSKQKKIVAVLLLSLLILSVTVGATVAYLVRRTDPAENVFVPVMVDCTPTSTAQGVMAVTNNGDITAYLRATVVLNWVAVNEAGNATGGVHANAPVEGVDCRVICDTTGTWRQGTDGFWYYTAPVAAGATTVPLVTSVTRLTEAPAGYALSVELLATGIQATPTAAVEQAWGVTLSGTAILPN